MSDRQLGFWRVGDRLGRGGNAQVYRVEHVETGQEAALKEINAHNVTREPYQRFLTEIETLRRLGDYPGVLPVLDYHVPAEPSATDKPWFVMPIATLLPEALVEADLTAVVRAIAEIATTLANLEREHGLAHRDIKPANLYELDGTWVIGDFGLVALPDRSGLTQSGKPLGPTNFIPFEMLNEPATANAFAADVYSLAKTLWVLACGVDFPPPGHQPADGAPHRIADYRPYPNAGLLDALVDQATQLRAAARPTMDRMAKDLRMWLELPAEQRDFDLTQAAAAVRASIDEEISESERVDRWKNATYAAIRRFDELAQPINEAMKAADPRARIGVIDSYADSWLKTMRAAGTPQVLHHWTRTSMLSAGDVVPYVLRVGRGIELLEEGNVVIRAMIDLGLDKVTQIDTRWLAPERVVPAGSAEQELALQRTIEELARRVNDALRTFAANAAQHSASRRAYRRSSNAPDAANRQAP